MYYKRLHTYKKIGYQVISGLELSKQSANTIFDSGNYTDIFEQDLVESEKNVIVGFEINDPEEIRKGPNDVKRFLKRIARTGSGEDAVGLKKQQTI